MAALPGQQLPFTEDTRRLSGPDPRLSLAILQRRGVLQRLRDLSRALQRTRAAGHCALRQLAHCPAPLALWGSPIARSGCLKTDAAAAGHASVGKARRPCWPHPCRERPKTTPPRVPGGAGGGGAGKAGPGAASARPRPRAERPAACEGVGLALGAWVGGGNTRGDRGAAGPLADLVRPLARLHEGAEVAPR